MKEFRSFTKEIAAEVNFRSRLDFQIYSLRVSRR